MVQRAGHRPVRTTTPCSRVLWQAGPLDGLFLTTFFRPGRGVNWPLGAVVTFPFILATDLLRGLADWPLSLAASLSKPLENRLFNTRARLRAAESGRTEGVDFEHGPDLWNLRGPPQGRRQGRLGPLCPHFLARQGPPMQYLLTALGPPTWNIMRRRTELLFQNEEDSGWTDPQIPARAEAPGGGNGGPARVPPGLGGGSRSGAGTAGLPGQVSLIGHSMGSIISNGILAGLPWVWSSAGWSTWPGGLHRARIPARRLALPGPAPRCQVLQCNAQRERGGARGRRIGARCRGDRCWSGSTTAWATPTTAWTAAQAA